MKQFFILFSIFLGGFFPALSQALEDVVGHELSVRIDPQQHRLYAVDKITLPANTARNVVFTLHKGLKVRAENDDIKLSPLKVANGSLYQAFKLQLPQNLNSFTLHYDGVIYHPLEAYGKEQARGFRNTPGLISEQGVYLAGGSYWVPQFENYQYLRFKLSVNSPAGWQVVSQGKRTQHEVVNGNTVDSWNSQSAQEEIYLIAAAFTEYSQTSDNIEAQVFLRKPDQKLADKYLDATAKYINMYEQLLGPYPYAKFALVENFWETGFGMPSFTLLGSKVIRLPFILNSSYPHEILHNWWGNGVYVDFDSGNWSEGLTAYLADHLIKEQQGNGANYRLQGLQKYSDYAAKGRDFPLREFRGRHSSASEAVGYGKTLMLFNMLRQQLGDKIFTHSLQQFYQQYQFKIASFENLKTSFEKVSGKNLKPFFAQWVNRSGAPDLKLSNAEVHQQSDGYQLSFSLNQMQAGKAYELQIPVAVTVEGQQKAIQSFLTMTDKQQQFDMLFTARPQRIDIDPEFDLFRKLALAETPPAYTQLFGARSLLVVLPRSANPTLKTAWEKFAVEMKNMGPEQVSIKWDDELKSLPANQAVTVLGWSNHFAQQMTTALTEHGVNFQTDSLKTGKHTIPHKNHSFALTTRTPGDSNAPRAFIATDLAEALPGLARKLPHYHKYSYLAFSGDEPQNKLKGRWPVNRSPMTVLFDQNATRGKLTERAPLIEAESAFDATKMMQTIQILASEAMQGRGFAEPGLDNAADYLATAFRQAGLLPAGDTADSYFQTWKDIGGDPERETRLKNIIGIIPGTHPTLKHENVVIGAHYDHLGADGWPDVRIGNKGHIHFGADDNASGVAVLLELARISARKMKPDRTIIFVAFSAEEAGRIGSKYYVKNQQKHPVSKTIGMLNLDTVGRLGNNKVLVLGANSASEWPHIFRGIGFVTGIPISMVNEDLDASDQISFHEAAVPAVQLFSGVNLDYHRPSDTVDKIDAEGLVKIASISQQVLQYLASREQPLSSNLVNSQTGKQSKSSNTRKVSLGSIPDFTFNGDGYRLDGVVPDSPAAMAGLTKGDIIYKINASEIHGLRDISTVLKSLQAGQSITIIYSRQGNKASTQAILKAK